MSTPASCAITITASTPRYWLPSGPSAPDIPDPDPLAVVYFADADPVFALAEHQKEPIVFRPEPATDDYQRTINESRHIPATSMAFVPLLSGDVTTGVLGFVKFGDRDWSPEELNALKAIASLFAQVQARVLAEEQLRYLAEHDDLTGLHNRRALLAHLDARLAARPAGTGIGVVLRPGPIEGHQRLSRPYRRRLVHPRPRRTAA